MKADVRYKYANGLSFIVIMDTTDTEIVASMMAAIGFTANSERNIMHVNPTDITTLEIIITIFE